jgi:hypothetical protein
MTDHLLGLSFTGIDHPEPTSKFRRAVVSCHAEGVLLFWSHCRPNSVRLFLAGGDEQHAR